MIKNLIFYLITLGIMLVLLEGFAFLAVHLVDRDDLFEERQSVFARFNEADLAEFQTKTADPVTGWRSAGPRTFEEENCLGEPIEYHYDAAGARVHDWFNAQETEIVIVGDSFTNGDEVSDSETYPARLSEQLGVSVANHGVGGYGPTQSLLNLQQNISRYPRAKVVVLGIMYENLYRMVNSYRPVLYSTSSNYTLKPYMAAGQIVPLPGSHVLENLDQFMQAADKSFDNDFWARPVAEFPYLLALGRSLGSNYFIYRKFQREFRKLGMPEYFLIFDDDGIERNLIALLNQYAKLAREWGVQPVAIFIPRNQLDTSSASEFIAQHRAEIDPQLQLGDVGEFPGVDWAAFNLSKQNGGNICHPSAYGYQTIADYIAEILRKNNNTWPTP